MYTSIKRVWMSPKIKELLWRLYYLSINENGLLKGSIMQNTTNILHKMKNVQAEIDPRFIKGLWVS